MQNKKTKVGIVGAGLVSDIYLSNMQNKFDNLEVICICSKHMEHAEEKAEKYKIASCTFDEMLANSDVEMIVNLTPVGEHYDIIKKALNAGKHVYTEKTITDNYEKALELKALAEEKGVYLGSAPDTFLGASLQTARKAIEDGLIGQVTSVSVAANRDNRYLLSYYPFLLLPGAGVFYDYAVYYMTAIVSLLGAVEQVGAFVSTPFPTHVNINPNSAEYGKVMETPNESRVSAILKFRNGITGVFHVDQDTIWKEQANMIIYGTEGILYLGNPDLFGDKVRLLKNSLPYEVEPEMVELPMVNEYTENSRGIGPSEMAEAIRNGKNNRASKELACHVLEVLEAILKSGKHGTMELITSTFEVPEGYWKK